MRTDTVSNDGACTKQTGESGGIIDTERWKEKRMLEGRTFASQGLNALKHLLKEQYKMETTIPSKIRL